MHTPRLSFGGAWLLSAAVALVLACRLGWAAEGLDASLRKAVDALYGDIQVHTLANGLKVYLKPVPGSPLVSTMVAYRTGSGDEDADHTGLAHYLEHLMFKGTDKLMPGDIDRLTLRHGGANNAYTDTDYTIYHFDFAADRWEQALEIEADRMRNLRIDERHEFETEKGAVIEELKRDEDDPFDLEFKRIAPLLHGQGPYGHPVIGRAEHVRDATARVIKDYYDRWYHPNNASLVIAGGFDPRAAMERVRALFEPIPAGKLPERKAPADPKRDAPVVEEFESKFAVPRLVMGFNGVSVADPDDLPLDLLAHVLGGSRASRLYRKLVEDEQSASEIAAMNLPGRHPGSFLIQVTLAPDVDRAEVEQMVLAELRKLRDQPVEATELKRAVRSLSASMVFNHESIHDLADSIALFTSVTDLDYLKTYLDKLARVTPADVQRAARRVLQLNRRVCVWSAPKPDPDAAPERADPRKARQSAGLKFRPAPGRSAGRAAPVAAATITDVQRVVLPNGLKLLLKEDRRLPIFHAAAEVGQVRLREPGDQVGVAELVGRMLSEGTIHHTSRQIADAIEDVGGQLEFSASGGVVKVLSPDLTLGLGILLECLWLSDFRAEEFDRHQAYLLSDIRDGLLQPDQVAPDLFRALVFGDHPQARPPLGELGAVAELTRDDCLAFHQRNFVPNNVTLALVGDFDTARIVEQVTAMTRDWKRRPVEALGFPVVAKPRRTIQRNLPMPHAAQLQIMLGHVGVRRSNPDYYKLLVMDYVLGTGPGFTDRLTSRLRDREGLAYSVSGKIAASAGLEPGVFVVSIGTDAGNLSRVKKEIIEEITRLQREKPTDSELEDAKSYLLGNLPFHLARSDDAAELLLSVERVKLGMNYLEEFRAGVSAVTAEDVRQAAAKYLDTRRLVIVAVGPIDLQGRPLER